MIASAEAVTASVVTSMEEVAVTARKRTEIVDDIPVQVSVFSATEVARARIFNLDDYVNLTPSLQRVRNGNDTETALLIRGLGNYGAGESSVGFFVDGNYRAAGSFATSHIFDIERIEVLHGPQGTLYGKSTTGGAINVIPKRPSHEPTAEFSATAATDSQYRATGAFGGPLVKDAVAARIAFSYEDFGGYYKNSLLREPVDDNRQLGVRGSVQWEPSDEITIRPSIYFRDQEQHGFSAERVAGPRDYHIGTFRRDTSNDFTTDAVGLNLSAEYASALFNVSSLTAYNANDEYFQADFDYQTSPIFYADRSHDRNDFSQEIRISSNDNRRWRWQIGTYYFGMRSDFSQRILFSGPRGIPLSIQRSVSHAATWSVFAQTDFDFSDRVTLSGSMRYDYDVRKQKITILNRRQSFNNVSGNAAISVALTPRANVYASISRMFRPGGFNDGGLPGFDEEKATVYEIGVKSTPRRWLHFTGALFNNRIKNAQNLDIDLATVLEITRNKGNAEIIGIEMRLVARPLEGLTFDLAGTWLDHEYDNFRAFRIGPAGPATIDFTRNDLQWVADYQAVAQVDYHRPISIAGTPIAASARVATSFTGPSAWDDFNSAYAKERQLIDLTLGLERGAWRTQFFVDNLLDEDYFTNFVAGFRFPFAGSDLGVRGEERQLGIRVSWRYE